MTVAAGTLIPATAVALQEGEPSRTAQSTALQRAAHQILDRPLVFEDPLALRIIGPGRRRRLEATLARHRRPGARARRAFIVTRSRCAEDELAGAVSQGTRQYVVLGAGLDTFAYRNPHAASLRVFEVDHPVTQGWKRSQLEEQGIDVPGSLSFVGVDFEKDSLSDRLQQAGFDRTAPAFVSRLGVTMYLEREAVMQTLRFVARTRGSRIVFDFSLPDELLSEAERARRDKRAKRVAALGEPWISRFDPASLARDLLAMGFSTAVPLGGPELNARYFSARTDGLRIAGSSGWIMTARV
jgi:methyltransferase (TIGR00027 family)